MWVPYFHTTLLSILSYTFDLKAGFVEIITRTQLDNWLLFKIEFKLEQGMLSHLKHVQVFELDKYSFYKKKR